MAIVQYGGGVVAFTGSLAGNTFQRNQSGAIARTRVNRSKRTTSKMAVTQARTFDLLSRWQNLAEANQLNWNTFAAAHTHTNIWGQEKTISGFNWFVSVNSNLALVGASLLDNPPDFTLPPAIETLEIVAIAGGLSFNYTISGDVDQVTGIIYTTPPIQATTLSFRQHLRYTHQGDAQNSEDLDVAADWSNIHGLPFPPSDPANFWVGGIMYTIKNETGLATPALLDTTKWTAT